MSEMRRMLAIVAVLLGCETSEPGTSEEPMSLTCSEIRRSVVDGCEPMHEEMVECLRDRCREQYPGDEDHQDFCNEAESYNLDDFPQCGLEEFNQCTIDVSGSGPAAQPEANSARELAYWCDIVDFDYDCELAQERAIERGVTECPLPEPF